MNTIPHGRPQQGGRFGLGELLLAVSLSVIWFLALRPAVDPDYGWHVENGRRVIDGSVFSGRDLYSWTATNLWIVHEWVTEAAMAVIHDSAGASGNSVAAALFWTLTFFLVSVRLRRRGFGWMPTIVTVVLGFLCTMMSVGVRPQVLELVYLSVLLLFLDSHAAGRVGGRKLVLGSALFAVLWVNTHGSFPLLVVVLIIAAAGARIRTDERWKQLTIAAVAAAVAVLANPWGWRIYQFATQSVTSKPTLESIDEWKPPRLLSGSLVPFDIAVILAAIALIALVVRQRSATSRVVDRAGPRAEEALLMVALLYLAASSGRHVMLFGVGAAPLIAWTLAAGQARLRRPLSAAGKTTKAVDAAGKAVINLVAAVAVAGAVVIAGWNVASPSAQARAEAMRYPVGLVTPLRAALVSGGRMLNEYTWGGYLIQNGLTPVFIDGRSELYGDEQLLRYARIVRLSEGWDAAFDSLGIGVVIVKREAKLAAALAERGWVATHRDSVGVLLQRP